MLHRVLEKNTRFLVITSGSGNVDQFLEFFYWQIPKGTLWICVTDIDLIFISLLRCNLTCEIRTFKVTDKLLHVPERLSHFSWKLAKINIQRKKEKMKVQAQHQIHNY